MVPSTALLCLAGLATAVMSHPQARGVKCPVALDGRVPKNMTLATFDTTASPYNPDYTKGQNLSWSQILKFPQTLASRFDLPGYKALEVTINDQSLFVPGGGSVQMGFRRAGLLLGNGSDETNVGVKTFHWSTKQDKKRMMNLTHEYMNVWHEANDYASNQFSINAGIMLSQDNPTDSNKTSTTLNKRLWKILDRKNNVIWTTPINWDDWQNFAVTMNIVNNTLQIYYSVGYAELRPVTGLIPNDNSGGGQYQIGMLKKPTETVTVVNDGYQESGINEGQIYGGIFIEDSASGCVSR